MSFIFSCPDTGGFFMLLNAQPALSPTHPRLGRAAYGIDNAAHRGVLAAGGQTIAVLATGLNRRYPAAHTELLDRIGDTGLLVSELPPGVAPTRDRFIARNRLMAALSGGVVIPEAGVRSGSIATVLTARGLGRGVGAVPGPVTSVASSGPNELIRQGVAALVTRPDDVIALLDSTTSPPQSARVPDYGVRASAPTTSRDRNAI